MKARRRWLSTWRARSRASGHGSPVIRDANNSAHTPAHAMPRAPMPVHSQSVASGAASSGPTSGMRSWLTQRWPCQCAEGSARMFGAKACRRSMLAAWACAMVSGCAEKSAPTSHCCDSAPVAPGSAGIRLPAPFTGAAGRCATPSALPMLTVPKAACSMAKALAARGSTSSALSRLWQSSPLASSTSSACASSFPPAPSMFHSAPCRAMRATGRSPQKAICGCASQAFTNAAGRSHRPSACHCRSPDSSTRVTPLASQSSPWRSRPWALSAHSVWRIQRSPWRVRRVAGLSSALGSGATKAAGTPEPPWAGCGWVSSTVTAQPLRAIASAKAAPLIPAPTTAQRAGSAMTSRCNCRVRRSRQGGAYVNSEAPSPGTNPAACQSGKAAQAVVV